MALDDTSPADGDRVTTGTTVAQICAAIRTLKTNINECKHAPIGVIWMYDGAGIASADTRTTQIGDEASDTISMAGWYVCNGQSSTPDLRNKFIRSESASGNTGGEDTHTLTINEIPSHKHTVNLSASGSLLCYQAGSSANGASDDARVGNTGGGAAHNNVPAYYSLIFIKKMS